MAHPYSNSSGIYQPQITNNITPGIVNEPAYTIKGEVLCSDGSPYKDKDDYSESICVNITSEDYNRICRLNEQGRFECYGLGDGTYLVSVIDRLDPNRIVCPNVQIDTTQEESLTNLQFVVKKTVPLVVRVLDKNCKPVINSKVYTESVVAQSKLCGNSNIEGNCYFAVPPGEFHVYITKLKQDKYIKIDPRTIDIRPAYNIVMIDLQIPQAREEEVIQGIFVNTKNKPVKGYIQMSPGIEFDYKIASEQFSLSLPEYIPSYGLIGYAYDESGSLAQRFIWQQESHGNNLVIVLEPRTKIIGWLVDFESNAMPNANLELVMPMPDGSELTVDEQSYNLKVRQNGFFEFQNVAVGPSVKLVAKLDDLTGQSELLKLESDKILNLGQIILYPKTTEIQERGVIQCNIIDENGKPLSSRRISATVTSQQKIEYTTDYRGYITITNVPIHKPVTITIEVPSFGLWYSVVTANSLEDTLCNFQVRPQGWNVVGKYAKALYVDKWFNHIPINIQTSESNIILIIFDDLTTDKDQIIPQIKAIYDEYHSKGLKIIAVHEHLSNQQNENEIIQQIFETYDGAPFAFCLDSDPNLVADIMPPETPLGATLGASHWLYDVNQRPAFFLIDKQGVVRISPKLEDITTWIDRLMREELF